MSTCLCSHPAGDHIGGGECVRWCGCGTYRPGTSKTVVNCRLPCEVDCEIAPVHCIHWHRSSRLPGWHDPAACDAGRNAATTEGA